MGKKDKKSSQNHSIAASADKSEASTSTVVAKPERILINVAQGGIAIINKDDAAIEGFFTGKLSSCIAVLLQGGDKFGLLHLDIYRNPDSVKSLIGHHFGKIDQDYDLNYFISPVFAQNMQFLLSKLPEFRANPEKIHALPDKLQASLYLNLLLFEKVFGKPLNPENIIAKPGSTCISFKFDRSSPDVALRMEFLTDSAYESLIKTTGQDAVSTFAGAALDVTKMFCKDQTQDVCQQYVSGDSAEPNFDIPNELQKDLELGKIDYSKFSKGVIEKLESILIKHHPLLSRPEMKQQRSALVVEALTNIQNYIAVKKSLGSEIGIEPQEKPLAAAAGASISQVKTSSIERTA